MPHHLQPIICFGASNFGRYKNTCLPQISRDSWWGAEILRCCGSHLSISRAKVIRFLLAIIFQISAIVPTSKWDAIGKWTSWQLMISLLILAFQKWHQIGHLPCNPKYVGEVTVWQRLDLRKIKHHTTCWQVRSSSFSSCFPLPGENPKLHKISVWQTLLPAMEASHKWDTYRKAWPPSHKSLIAQ